MGRYFPGTWRVAAAFAALTACAEAQLGAQFAKDIVRDNRSETQTALAPEIFDTEGLTIWDGARTLKGVWVAHPLSQRAQRVRVINLENGLEVEGAMFRRDASISGPSILVSSDTARGLGLQPGRPTQLRIVALKEGIYASPATQIATAKKTGSTETAALQASDRNKVLPGSERQATASPPSGQISTVALKAPEPNGPTEPAETRPAAAIAALQTDLAARDAASSEGAAPSMLSEIDRMREKRAVEVAEAEAFAAENVETEPVETAALAPAVETPEPEPAPVAPPAPETLRSEPPPTALSAAQTRRVPPARIQTPLPENFDATPVAAPPKTPAKTVKAEIAPIGVRPVRAGSPVLDTVVVSARPQIAAPAAPATNGVAPYPGALPDGVFVLAGVFSVEGNAKKLVTSMNSRSLPAQYVQRDIKGQPANIVMIGPLVDDAQVAKAIEAAADAGAPGAKKVVR